MTPKWVTKHQWMPEERAWTWRQSCPCSLCTSETRGMAQQAGLTGMRPVSNNSVFYHPIYGYQPGNTVTLGASYQGRAMDPPRPAER